MEYHTIESGYEYRMKAIIKKLAEEYSEEFLENMTPKDLDDFIWAHIKAFGQYVFDDMLEWMSIEDWREEIVR